jgi:hypothetical protein
MTAEELAYLKRFYRAVVDRPLNAARAADKATYVPFYADPELDLEDPVRQMVRSIEFAPSDSSALLFSGFNGTGKTTELFRFRQEMQKAGYLVLFFDIFEYLTPAALVDISDFLMAVTGGFSDALEAADVLPKAKFRSYWDRLTAFLQTEVQFEEVTGRLGLLDIKASLRSDETFRVRLQKAAKGHLARLGEDVRAYIAETLAAIPPHEGVVLIVDSIEKFSGTMATAGPLAGPGVDEVQASIARLFTAHSIQLKFPGLHAVYTVPPWLNILSPNVAAAYSAGLHVLRPIKVRRRGGERDPERAALDALHCLIKLREPEWERLLGRRAVLDRLSLACGGHVRDLLRLITETINRADSLPVDTRTIDQAITQLRSEFVLAEDETSWLAEIARSGNALPSVSHLPRLTTFLDSHLVLCYSNGAGWYDVHPVVREDVLKQAAAKAPPP